MNKINTQVMIAGCGPVGLALANCLAKSVLIDSIVLLDRKVPDENRQLPTFANQRVYSINGPTIKLLNNLQILPAIRRKGKMQNVEVISKQSLSFINWYKNQANVIENDQLLYSMMKELKKKQYQNKVYFIQDQVNSFNIDNQNCIVKLKNNDKQISTKLLVGSDGITSNIKRLAGISHYGWKYNQKAIVCTMETTIQNNNLSAYQIYHDGNVLALLPLWDNYISLVWSLGLPDFQYLIALDNEQFKTKLNNVIRNSNYQFNNQTDYMKIPQITQIVNNRLSFPLSTMQSSTYTRERIALIGDAAHTIHPMAGLGVNSGIMDSMFLANNIIRNVKTGNDIGDLIALGNYEAKAKVFNYTNSLAMEAIKKGFQTDVWAVNTIREFGMKVVQNSSIIKQALKNVVDDKSLKYEWETY